MVSLRRWQQVSPAHFHGNRINEFWKKKNESVQFLEVHIFIRYRVSSLSLPIRSMIWVQRLSGTRLWNTWRIRIKYSMFVPEILVRVVHWVCERRTPNCLDLWYPIRWNPFGHVSNYCYCTRSIFYRSNISGIRVSGLVQFCTPAHSHVRPVI